jgi:hypothetical protein
MRIRRGREPVVDDRPMVSAHSGGVRLELGNISSPWTVELTLADCERIAEALGYVRPGIMRPADGSDS